MICAGIDAGSRTIKVALIRSETFDIFATDIINQGVAQESLANTLFERVLKDSGVSRKEIEVIVATGYGRNAIGFADKTVTEITCHAVGVQHLIPEAKTIIDIGGQDSKFIRLGNNDGIEDFAMNDRCAAGTGCFLEMVARRIGIPLESLGKLAAKSRKPAAISSMCIVFAETEIIGLLAKHTPPSDIVAGVQASIASRILSMAGRNITEPIIFTGGVALVGGMDMALQTVLEKPVAVSPQPQMTGAIGAAILAASQLNFHKGT